MSSKSKKGQRAIAGPGAGIGDHRYELYSHAWDRIGAAASSGYYLEAISLLETIIADRMESRASYLSGRNVGFSTLGELVSLFRQHEQIPEFRGWVDRVDRWRVLRNQSLHEMVKFTAAQPISWQEKLETLPGIVTKGQELLREFAELDEASRQESGARPPATWPNAFGQEREAGRARRTKS